MTISILCTGMPLGVLADDGLEFVPFVGYRFGGSFDDANTGQSLDLDETGSWGFTISKLASRDTRYEFLYSHQDTRLTDRTNPDDAFDLDVHYLHLGGTVDMSHDRVIPFFSGGIGMTHMSPGRSGFNNETRLSLSFGGGLKWYPTDRLGIRFEMRGYGTLMDTNGSLFCDSGCDLQLSSDLFPQFETNLGLIFSF
ncbi:MAG: hypothetical protein KZQ93_16700 [Candidatus Thiodiazotropha sp. (ex Monitilora ramsayi)]|nr:hypothetical protein [Candidatus Thiodiazotropha sp. (ex Monitilora ramsayi)]